MEACIIGTWVQFSNRQKMQQILPVVEMVLTLYLYVARWLEIVHKEEQEIVGTYEARLTKFTASRPSVYCTIVPT